MAIIAIFSLSILTSCQKDPGMTLQATYFENAYISSIDISSGWNVTIVQDDDVNYATIEYSEVLTEKMYINLDSKGKLTLGLRNCHFNTSNTVKNATIYVSTLESIELSGGSEARLYGEFECNSLEVDLSGGSIIRQGEIASKFSEFDLSGGSIIRDFTWSGDECDVEASGGSEIKAILDPVYKLYVDLSGGSMLVSSSYGIDFASLSLSGGSSVDLRYSQVMDMEVEFSGASTGKVNVNNRIFGDLSGGSDLYYLGNAYIDVYCSGDSQIRRL